MLFDKRLNVYVRIYRSVKDTLIKNMKFYMIFYDLIFYPKSS